MLEMKMGVFAYIILMLVLYASTLMPLFVTSVQAQFTWEIEEIGKGYTDIAVYHSLALDSNDRPHISYWDNTGFAMDLVYAWRDGGWTFANVDQDGDVGRFSSIALDSNDYPHITYCNYSGGYAYELKYARWDGTTWHNETIGAGGPYSSIALDSNDHPHISYFLAGYQDLRYAWWDGTTWHKETVDGDDPIVEVGHYNSLALDSNDHPHISYYDDEWKNLRYAWWDGGWHKETVDDSAWVGIDTSIALDSNDVPHISYYDFTYTRLKYANRTGGTWTYASLDEAGDVGQCTSIALDSSDIPHISYYQTDPHFALKYATRTGSTWSTDEVDLLEDFTDTDYDIKAYSSIALDSHDYPHIIYADLYWWAGTFNWYLKYARPTPPEVVDVIASDSEGHFSVTINAGADKGAPVTDWWDISTTNIASYTVTLTDGDMVLVVEGQLEDPSLPGQIVLQVDPEGEIVTYSIEVRPFTRDALWDRAVEIVLAWPAATLEQREELWEEIVEIILLWPTAP